MGSAPLDSHSVCFSGSILYSHFSYQVFKNSSMMQKIDKNDPIGIVPDLTIDSVAFGGKGVGRHEGKVVFVEGAVPGDSVRVALTARKKTFSEGVIDDFVKTSPLRNEAPCKVYGECGGCHWQDIDQKTQLEWKSEFLQSALTRIGKLDSIQFEVLPSPDRFHYRSRILLRGYLESGKLKLGFFRRKARTLVAVSECPIASKPINNLMESLLQDDWSDCADQKFRLEIQEVPVLEQIQKSPTEPLDSLSDSGVQNLIVTVFPAAGRGQDLNPILSRLKVHESILWSGSVFELKKAPMLAFEGGPNQTGGDLVQYALPGQFHQVNRKHNLNMRELVKEWVLRSESRRVLDVFCGSGNLSFPLVEQVDYLQGVELNARAIAAAKKTARAGGLDHFEFFAEDAVKHLKRVSDKQQDFSMVILDPPREGFLKGMPYLKRLGAHHIIYISCDPNTLARDLKMLCNSDSEDQTTYKIDKIVALDFFPHTFHIETAVLLSSHSDR